MAESEHQKMAEDAAALLEKYKQEIHECKLKLGTSKALHEDILTELEFYKSTAKKHELALEQQKEKEATLNRNWREKVQALEEEFEDKKLELGEEVAALKLQLQDVMCRQSEVQQPPSADDSTDAKVSDIAAIEEIDSLKHETAQLKRENVYLLRERDEMKEQLLCTSATLQEKVADLSNVQELLQDTQGELQSTRAELEAIRAGGDTLREKGNSLFAEVEDRRQDMRRQMAALRTKYSILKRQHAIQSGELSKLRERLLHSVREGEAMALRYASCDKELVQSYEDRIKELVQRVTQLERLKEPQVRVLCSSEDLKWVEELLEEERNKVAELRRMLDESSMGRLLGADKLRRTVMELEGTRSELTRTQLALDLAQSATLTSDTKQDDPQHVPDIKKPEPLSSIENSVTYEQLQEKRNVHFAPNMQEKSPKKLEKKDCRNYETVYVPSLKQQD